ncbi:MAG TPA: single-stranded-DNA-specific exonuclease RecJ [bacterium]|nr:single-stranded-DNA-specific exonuclease RecJ [bacterium]
MSWRLSPPHPDETALGPDLERLFDLHPLVARLLLKRGLSRPEDVRLFLDGSLADFPDPFALPDMDRAVDRLMKAHVKREKIAVFGDYDVDGITGTAQLAAYFREIGLPVRPLLPHRMQEGYGLTERAVLKIAAEKPDLLITVDNGTKSAAEISHLRRLGVDVIVIDHHETPSADAWPPVEALVNPKRTDSRFAERDVASAGLVFLLLMAFRARCREQGISPLPNLKRYLDLACLGTIADVVPLTGTNRLIVRHGLEELGATLRPGLQALRETAAVASPVSVTHVAFRFAPRINAAGRLADPKIALDLLLSEKAEEAAVLANRLEELNRERQSIEEKVTREAFLQIEETQADRKGLVAAGRGWHLGVVGIVAAKLTERFGRPAIALSLGDDGREAKGSARSVPGFSVYEPLKRIESLMLKFGGHAAAAGLTLEAGRLDEFSRAFDREVRTLWDERRPVIEADANLPLNQVDAPLVRDLARLEPFGPGNPEPVFLVSGVALEGCRVVGASGGARKGHLKAVLRQNGIRLESIGFDWGHYLETARKIPSHEVAFCPQINHWNGQSTIQLKIKLIEPSD